MKPKLAIYRPAQSAPKQVSPRWGLLLDAVTVAVSVLGFLSAVVFLLTMG